MTAPLILCIEDEPSLRDDIAAELREASYRVIAVGDAQEALDQLDSRRPDLILCDIVMPGMDGHALLAHLRATRPNFDDIPFVFLTALSSREQMIEGHRAGADDYLTKPIDYDLLHAMVAARLDQVARLRSSRRDAPSTAVLDRLAVGVVLLGEDGGVRHANRAAQILAREAKIDLGPRIGVEGGDGRKLVALAKKVASGQVAEAALLLETGGRRLMVLGRPLGQAAGKDGIAAMLTISDPERQQALDAETLRQLFDLTPSEACVALLIAEGLRRDQVADRLDVSSTTVAFHLRNIFDKTGLRRQADLLGLVRSMPMVWTDP
ncbi:response regulator [Thalassorhabdomicrobium marinisediminis]|uniref:Two-component system response regulator n=1 Tax=Thalassorhabdomicrobium marinisediminis TaxID=2170577 RepID=A0A2T7FTT7_9RHOB|nr:response regulator [Thalassorhabdomicrobium marinisediminis]PVA05580.1 two-component system response regulator [Thalassorhabdomicrobium marinisediminis]